MRKELAALPFASLPPLRPPAHLAVTSRMAGMIVVVIVFIFVFQLADVVMVIVVFAGGLHIRSSFFVAYEVEGIRREGDMAEYIPNVRRIPHPSPFRLLLLVSGYCHQCQMRGGSWACVAMFTTAHLVGGI